MREITKETGSHTNGERWSRTRRIPLTIPEIIFMMKETFMEMRKRFQPSKVRVTPSISAISRLTTRRARKPNINKKYVAEGPEIRRGSVGCMGEDWLTVLYPSNVHRFNVIWKTG
jgi:hypothetical protein